MNKKALLDYALFARKELETQIALSLNKLGIYKDKILKANVVGDFTIIEGNPDSYSKRVYNLRKKMIGEYFEGEEKFETVVEEFAYTWFNRLVALRFMEIHDYFPHGFHVLTSRDGSYEPEILSNLPYVSSELNLEEEVVHSLREQNKIEDLYRYVLVKQCTTLSKIIPDIFDVREDYLELLLPNNLLSQDSVVRKIEMIPEEDFMNDIEVVGWLYQFYNSVKKDEVFASKETITKDTLPAVTQLFTPDWIVRYMADNSVGRLWLESNPNSSLRSELKYYVDDAKQDEETQKKLDEIKYKNVNPEDIKIIEPCCGSGHILVYVFDLLLKMYLEQGYNKRDIPALILKNNLYGLDVDKRAAQLAKFSLIMKARSIDNRFFNEDRFVNPRVFEIKDSQLLISLNYKEAMKNLHFSDNSIRLAEYLVNIFECGKVIGSLLKIVSKDYTELINDIKRCKEVETPGLFEGDFYDKGLKRLRYLIRVARVLARKYDVMITNPPYVGISSLEAPAKNYAFKYYPNSKTDMFAMFMETDFVKQNGFRSMINMQGWMFLSSYEKLRHYIVTSNIINSMLHLGAHAFDTIGGEVVSTVSFVLRQTRIDSYTGKYIRLTSFDSSLKKESYMYSPDVLFIVNQDNFKGFPGYQIAYWTSENVRNAFKLDKIEKYYFSDGRNITGDNNKYLRFHWEVDVNKIGKGKKWLNYVKGGSYRKWFGNIVDVVDWSPKAREFYHKNSSSRIIAEYLWYKEGVTWNLIASGNGCFRLMTGDNTFDMGGPSVFPRDSKTDLIYTIAYLNSNVVSLLNSVVNQTINYQVEHILSTPIIFSDEIRPEIDKLANENILIAKKDWDDNEYSNDYFKDPLFKIGVFKIRDIFSDYLKECQIRFSNMKQNELRINELFIKLFNLEDELENNVEDSRITISIPTIEQSIRKLISYFIGILMGRYSINGQGITYAGGPFDRSKFADYVDEDGILPIYQFVGINDGLTKSICDMVKRVYGDTYYRENLDFIADALGRKSDEGAEEAINRYLNDEFYKDHLKVYQNRPIYWMFNSGKVGAFKCLVYLHRYDKNALAKINAKYFLPRTAMYKAERERLTDQLTRADIAQRKKLEAQLKKIEEAEDELQLYGQVLDHMANQYIDIDLDDGVKVNYVKFQGISLEVNGATIKKDLLVPFGLEKKK